MDENELERISGMTTGEKLVALFTLMSVVRDEQQSTRAKVDALHTEMAEARDIIKLVKALRRELIMWCLGAMLSGGALGVAGSYAAGLLIHG